MFDKFIQPIETRKSVFINVLGGSIFTSFNQATDEEFRNGTVKNYKQSPRWYSKEADPMVYDPHVLVSSAHYSHMKDFRGKMRADKDTIVFVDSGGYQLATGVKPNHTREKALTWSEANGNLFPILDLPAFKKFSMQQSIDYTVESAKYYADNRSNSDCSFLNVLSATKQSGMEQWYSAVKDFPFDGWCYDGHANFLPTIIQSILFLLSKGEFNRKTSLHIFGTTSLAVIPYIIYAQHLLNKMGVDCQLSFDSSYAFRNAGFGKYFIFPSFKGMSALVLSNKHDWTGLKDFSKFGCDCPVCEGMDDIGHLFSGNAGSHFYSLIGMHNYMMMLKFKTAIEGLLSFNIPDIIESLPTDMMKNFKTIDEAFKMKTQAGMDHIGLKFITKNNSKSIVSKNLSSFF